MEQTLLQLKQKCDKGDSRVCEQLRYINSIQDNETKNKILSCIQTNGIESCENDGTRIYPSYYIMNTVRTRRHTDCIKNRINDLDKNTSLSRKNVEKTALEYCNHFIKQ